MSISHLESPAAVVKLIELLMDAGIKSTGLLCIAFAVSLVLRKSSAAVRHLVWVAALGGLLVLPVLSLLLPAWNVLPAWAPLYVAGLESTSIDQTVARSPAAVGADVAADAASVDSSALSQRSFSPRGFGEAAAVTVEETAEKVEATSAHAALWPGMVALGWMAGLVVTLIPVFAGLYTASRRRRRSMPVVGSQWGTLLVSLKECLGIRRQVLLRTSQECLVPLTFGILRPTILLSDTAESWPEEKQRIVLLHELAHIQRFDCLALLLANFICSLYWFQPLAWFAAARMRSECERACDDVVLRTGGNSVKASVYASTLLEYAAVPKGYIPLGSLAMARSSTLEGRLVAILSSSLNRRGLTRRTSVLVATFALLVVTLVACLGPTSARGQTTVFGVETRNETGEDIVSGRRMPGAMPVAKPTSAAQDGQWIMPKVVEGPIIRHEKGLIETPGSTITWTGPAKLLWSQDGRAIGFIFSGNVSMTTAGRTWNAERVAVEFKQATVSAIPATRQAPDQIVNGATLASASPDAIIAAFQAMGGGEGVISSDKSESHPTANATQPALSSYLFNIAPAGLPWVRTQGKRTTLFFGYEIDNDHFQIVVTAEDLEGITHSLSKVDNVARQAGVAEYAQQLITMSGDSVSKKSSVFILDDLPIDRVRMFHVGIEPLAGTAAPKVNPKNLMITLDNKAILIAGLVNVPQFTSSHFEYPPSTQFLLDSNGNLVYFRASGNFYADIEKNRYRFDGGLIELTYPKRLGLLSTSMKEERIPATQPTTTHPAQ